MDVYDLPYEVLYNILANLSDSQLTNICISSKYGYDICRDELLWRKLIHDKYDVVEKIQVDKSWYHNYVYITTLFKKEQLEVINKLRQISPAKFELLMTLHNYTQYFNILSNQDSTLDTVVVYVEQSNNPFDYDSDILSPNTTYKILYSLTIKNNDLISDRFTYADTSVARILQKNKVFISTSDNNKTYYYAVLNKQQLSALRFMYR